MGTDAFHIELSLARMAVAFCGRHKDDPGVAGTVWQVSRLVRHYKLLGEHDRAAKLQRIVDWFEAGAVVSGDMAVLSESELEQQRAILSLRANASGDCPIAEEPK